MLGLVVTVVVRPAGAVVGTGMRIERRLRSGASDLAGRVALLALDDAMRSPYADVAVDRVLASPLAEHALANALRGRLVDVMVRELLTPETVDRALESPELQQLVDRVLESPMAESALSRVMDDALGRLPESPALWALIEQVVSSPAVTTAITQQGMGVADEVAQDLRSRSRGGDALLERAAHRMLRRRPRPEGPAAPAQEAP
jgi:hypothetical protein